MIGPEPVKHLSGAACLLRIAEIEELSGLQTGLEQPLLRVLVLVKGVLKQFNAAGEGVSRRDTKKGTRAITGLYCPAGRGGDLAQLRDPWVPGKRCWFRGGDGWPWGRLRPPRDTAGQ